MLKSKRVDMGSDKLFSNILKFVIPIVITGLLQKLYNAADIIVVGRYAGQTALAGVGTTGNVVDFLLNFFLGVSAGVGVVIGRAMGEKNDEKVNRIVHTAVLFAFICGVAIACTCIIFAKPLLKMIDVPDDVMPQAKLYMQIVSIGHIPSLLYNVGAMIIRANGDTKRPLYIIMISGLVNVLLNLFFVVVLKMSTAGVALATVISQTLTAIAIIYILKNETGSIRLIFSKLAIRKREISDILKDGIPAGIQTSVFSLANIVIQSCINGFGSAAIAGYTASANICSFYLIALNAFSQVSAAFVSYNVGAKDYAKVNRVIRSCFGCVCILWFFEIVITYTMSETLLKIYIPGSSEADMEAMKYGFSRMMILGPTYGFCGLMNTMAGAIRGIGHSFKSMIVSVIGVSGIRLLWVATIFRHFETFEVLHIAYPISWMTVFVVYSIVYLIYTPARRKNIETS